VLAARDLRGFLVEGMLPMVEFRTFLLRAFDPDGKHERLPHIKALNHAGLPLVPLADAPKPPDPTARSKEIFAALVRWLYAQREGIKRGRAIEMTPIDPALEEWTRLIADGSAHFMGVAKWQPGDTGTLVHAVNTAVVAMTFCRDLGLPRSAIREVCELSLMLGLGEALGMADRRAPVEEPIREEQRFHAAGLLLTTRLNRLATAASVAAIEAGLQADATGKGPGLLASIHALSSTFDGLTGGTGLGSGQALEAMNGRLRGRFSSDLVGLFTQWAFGQASAPPVL